ncbi:MAG: class I SAM-dependent methyltransferase [Desulfovibrionaceae bacterium]|nr:class I SAM-dependent methyltransferase [Desulfovibrionaceae bacterium]
MNPLQILKRVLRQKIHEEIDGKLLALKHESLYLQTEVSRLRSLVRYLVADKIRDFPMMYQTRGSFDFQWGDTLEETRDPSSLNELCRSVCEYSQLEKGWFAGKKALDAGCGSGRFSLAMLSMGAEVVAIDQSANAVNQTKKSCAAYEGQIRVQQHDLLQPLPFDETFDLVWSYGVLHHTGNTHGALKNIVSKLSSGGRLFLMLYGEPPIQITEGDTGSLAYYAETERIRRETCIMSYQERFDYLKSRFSKEELGGWFDAISPEINDTYAFYEIQMWLHNLGFVNIRRTQDHPNHHVAASRI